MPEILCGHCGGRHGSVQLARLCAQEHPLSSAEEPSEDWSKSDRVAVETEYSIPIIKKEDLHEDTLYKVDETVYKTTRSKTSGMLYASKMLDVGNWIYAPGAIKLIKPENKLSLEEAKSYGRLTGKCIVCGRHLTDASSVEAGIGPICAERF